MENKEVQSANGNNKYNKETGQTNAINYFKL